MAEATRTQPTTPDARQPHASTTQKQAAVSTCCGGPAPTGTDACCARDAQVKSTGGSGCGCGPAPTSKKTGCCIYDSRLAPSHRAEEKTASAYACLTSQ